MKELLLTWKLKIQARIMGALVWKNILTRNGVSLKSNLAQKKLDEVTLNIYRNTFKSSKKDKEIKLEAIGKTYDNGFKAVHDFHLDIDPKEFVCLLGPSGCGKTTILRMVAGLDHITEGKYLMGGNEMNGVHPSERRTSMVFQNYALYPFMSVYDNIAFGLKLKTFKNLLTTNNIKRLIELETPFYNDMLDLKYKIKEISNEGKDNIVSLKIAYAKAKKDYDTKEEDLEAIRTRILEKQDERKNNIEDRNARIAVVKEELSKLKAKSNEKAKQNREEQKVKSSEVKALIQERIIEEKEYFNKKLQDIPMIKENIKELKAKAVAKGKEKLSILKEMQTYAKAITKSNNEISESESKSVIKTFDERIATVDNEIEGIKLDIGNHNQELQMIKHSKMFEIQELKNKLAEASVVKREIIESAIIWKQSIGARVRELANLVGIGNFLKRRPSALSGGQRQRVALIRAISKDAQLFLFDEPLSNLDAKLRGTMRAEIKAIHNRIGSTSLYVTHDQIEAMTMADKVVVMNVGYVQQVGHPKDLYENPSNIFVARFIGTPTINTFTAKMANSKTVNIFGENVTLELSPEKDSLLKANHEKDVIVGIRPQHISVSASSASSYGGSAAAGLGSSSTKKSSFDNHVGVVTRSELIGEEYVLQVKLGSGQKVSAVTDVSKSYEIGDFVKIHISPSKIMLFNAKTGIAITSIINDATKAAIKVWEDNVKERIDNKMLLDNEKSKKTLTEKLFVEIKGRTTEANKVAYVKNKVAEKLKTYEDYSLIELDDDEEEIQS